MDGRATVNDNLRNNTQKNIVVMCNIPPCALLCTSCNGDYFGCFCAVHYSVHYAVWGTFFMFHRRVPRRLTSEQVVSMMDDLSDNDIPSDSDDDRLESDDGEVESDEVDQSSTSESSSESESDQEPAPPTKRGKK